MRRRDGSREPLFFDYIIGNSAFGRLIFENKITTLHGIMALYFIEKICIILYFSGNGPRKSKVIEWLAIVLVLQWYIS